MSKLKPEEITILAAIVANKTEAEIDIEKTCREILNKYQQAIEVFKKNNETPDNWHFESLIT